MKTLIFILFPVFVFAGEAGKVAKLEGQLWKIENGKKTELKQDDGVTWGDQLETGASSRATIKLGDAAFLLNSNSKVTLTQDKKSETTVLGLIRGGLLSFINKKSENKEVYRVKTKAAVIGVRGTTFFVQDGAKQGNYLCACYGKINVRTNQVKAGEDLVGQGHNTQRDISADGKLTAVNDPKGHTEEDVKALQSLFK